MSLASLDDVNSFLPTDKIEATEGNEETDRALLDSERLIRGHLAGVFSPTELASWADPATTPELIRAIAGRLTAAFFYRLRYSEDTFQVPEYAQTLYQEAMDLLMQIKTGDVELEEVTEGTQIQVPGSSFFWPNDTTSPPKFTMDAEY